jgi:hypothetical protein
MAAAQRPPRKRLRVSQVFVSDTHMEPLAGFGQPRAAYTCAASANDGGVVPRPGALMSLPGRSP